MRNDLLADLNENYRCLLLCSWYSKPLTQNGSETSDSSGQIVHCLIYHHDGNYGFAEPYFIHRTLKDLVLHYRERSLDEHNDELDTTLLNPIGEVEFADKVCLPSVVSAKSSQSTDNQSNSDDPSSIYY